MNAHQIAKRLIDLGLAPVALCCPKPSQRSEKPRRSGQGTVCPRLAEPARAAQRRRHARPDARVQRWRARAA